MAMALAGNFQLLPAGPGPGGKGAHRLHLATFVYDFGGRATLPDWMQAVLTVMQGIVIFYTAYHLFFIPFGFRTPPRGEPRPPEKSFAIVIPAHNEEAVLGPLLENLRHLDYPRRLYDVYVVADNCSDGTARVAREGGAIVIERFNPALRGKGHALDYAFRRIQGGPRRYDAVVIVDADNLVDAGFLSAMNTRLCRGERVIQGYLDVKNPDDTWVSAGFAMSYWVSNRFWCLAKHNLGFSVPLGGTGMCIEMALLEEIGWATETLTEDLEFMAKALARGVRTTWAHEAVIYDEKPLTFVQSFRQRLRWVQGGVQVARRYFAPLLLEGLRRWDGAMVEGAILLCRPFYLVLATALGLFSLLAAERYEFTPFLLHVVPLPVWWSLGAVQFVLPLLALALDRVPLRPYRFLPLLPVFAYSWVLVTWCGVLLSHRHGWSHTRHTRGISYGDLIQERSAGMGG